MRKSGELVPAYTPWNCAGGGSCTLRRNWCRQELCANLFAGAGPGSERQGLIHELLHLLGEKLQLDALLQKNGLVLTEDSVFRFEENPLHILPAQRFRRHPPGDTAHELRLHAAGDEILRVQLGRFFFADLLCCHTKVFNNFWL